MDILAPITMKNAAKCDKQCELQNSSSIRSLNASSAVLTDSIFVSVCFKIHHLNAIETNVSLVKHEGADFSKPMK
jgi:hypothetical protein